MNGITLSCSLIAALLVSCTPGSERDAGAKGMKRALHANGLAVTIPETLFVEEYAQGFIISPPGPKDFREPQQVLVALTSDTVSSASRWNDTCRVGELRVHYRVDEVQDAGAGEQYTFRAWVRGRRGCIRVLQVEKRFWPSVPDFDLAWTVIAGLGDGDNPQ